MRTRKQVVGTVGALLAGVGLVGFSTGCESDAAAGGLIGAGIGALAGQALGHDTESTLMGAAAGGAGGYIIGNEMDKKKLRERNNYDW